MTKEEYLIRVRTALCIDPVELEMTPEEYAEALDEIGDDVSTLAEAHEAVVAEESSNVIYLENDNAVSAFVDSMKKNWPEAVRHLKVVD